MSLSLPYNITDERTLRAMTGVNLKSFEHLLPHFAKLSLQARDARRKPTSEWKRAVGGGAKSSPPTPAHELIFILFYLKAHPTYDVLSNRFLMKRSTAFQHVRGLSLILRDTLAHLSVLPERTFASPSDLCEYFKGKNIDELLIDATEREYFRYKDKDKRAALYSGKKKAFA